MKKSLQGDRRLADVERLGALERELTRQAVATRQTLASLVTSLLPAHAPVQHVQEVVDASGYSRTLIDGLRGGKHPWHRVSDAE